MPSSRLPPAALIALAALCTACSLEPREHPLSVAGSHGLMPARSGPWTLRLQGVYGPLREYPHEGATFVEGVMGQRYTVRVTNPTSERVEAVITVDGRDVISGDPGDFVQQRGYIIEPHGSVEVEGFRTNLSEVAAFRFTTPEGSYSGRRGTPAQVGVIGVAIFKAKAAPVAIAQPPRQKMPPPRWGFDPQRGEDLMEESASRAPAAEGEAPGASPDSASGAADRAYGAQRESARRRSRLGTQFGERRHSQVVEVPFERASPRQPDAVMALYYDDRQGLADRGIPLAVPVAHDPQPFPGLGR